MRPLNSNSLLLMERTIGGLWSRQTAILDNIANAETPGYKAKYVTFEDTLKARLQSASGASAPRAEMESVLEGIGPTVREAQESTRMDENGVNVTEQNLELVRTAYALQYAMQAVNSDLSTLRIAIKGQ